MSFLKFYDLKTNTDPDVLCGFDDVYSAYRLCIYCIGLFIVAYKVKKANFQFHVNYLKVSETCSL